jgi:glucose-1-phosphate cytidylyltransferase
MKTVILCGGRGTRLGEHGASVPKGLIEIGGRPLLWRLMKIYAHHGLNDFVLCLGHLGDAIKRYFLEHHWLDSDFTLDLESGRGPQIANPLARAEDWRITFVDTGLDTNTGGRIKKIEPFLTNGEPFCVTYGDGLADINLAELIEFHRRHGRTATLTAVHPRSSFGLLKLNEMNAVTEFVEKPVMEQWINGGFFVFNPEVFDYLTTDSILETAPLQALAREGQLMAFPHTGFWKCMDTYKDHLEFNQLWDEGLAGWNAWK